MADKVTVEEINGTLALERLKHREKLLAQIRRGSERANFVQTLAVIMIVGLMGLWVSEHGIQGGQSFALPMGGFIAFMLFQTGERIALGQRFSALLELLELDKLSSSNVISSQKNEKS